MPDGTFLALVVMQIVIALVLIAIMVRLVRVIRDQGGTVVPPQLTAKLRKLFGKNDG